MRRKETWEQSPSRQVRHRVAGARERSSQGRGIVTRPWLLTDSATRWLEGGA